MLSHNFFDSNLLRCFTSFPFVTFLQNDVEDMLDLSEMRQDLMDRVTGIMNKANEYRSSFDLYTYLWLDDRNEFMRQFLLYNHVLTAEEIEAHAEEGVPENPPTLAQFKEQVPFYLIQKTFMFCIFPGWRSGHGCSN